MVISTISFKSRNYEIRRADNIAREIATKYPMLSSSKISSLPKAELFMDAINKLDKNLLQTRINAIRALSAYNFKIEPKNKILKFLKIMKNDKLGNCAEMTNLATIFTYIKNIKDTCVADIKNKSDEHLNHVVLYVNNGKKPYIIDTWLGFADYLPNAIQRYKSEFSFLFPFEKATSQDFMFNKYEYTSDARIAIEKCTNKDLLEISQNI